MYRDIESIIMKESQRYINHQENKLLATQKLTNVDITNDNMCCKYCTESLCLDIKKKCSLSIDCIHL